jgi:hypothetical protein
MKHFFAILFTFSSLFSYSQLPDGSVAPNFTTTDLNGNEHQLYDYLDMGYTVIIQISASWSSPDWNYHSGGTLEAIWAAHGPAGQPGVSPNTTDDVMILWFEGDPGTALSELENSAFGNWLAPNGVALNYPIINDDNIASLYNLPYWPIIYTICPNGILKESGQASAEAHYSNLSECIAPSEGNNAAFLNFESTIQPSGCEASASGNLSVIVQNMGTELLTSFTVEVMGNGQSFASESFNGSLNVFETTTIDFGNLTIYSETIEIMITSNDANSSDNLLTESYSFGSGETESEVTVVLLTDNYASEIYLQITDENGDVIWSEGNENVSGNYDTGQENPPADPTNPLENNQSYEWTVNLPSENCHTFFIGDYYGDGLDASQWGGTNGNWTVNDNDDAQIAQMTTADFEGSDDASFENTQAADPSSINDESNIAFSVYPNPIQSDAKLSFGLTKPSKVRLDITNVLGEIVLSNAYSLKTGNNTIDINVDKMTNGIYFAHLSINSEINTVKITVSK